jgi:plasmid maintenance system antidote protein VapI
MIRTKREYKASLKKLMQNDDALSKQRSELERLELSKEDIDLAMSPLINFRNQLKEDVKIYEGIKGRDWDLILNLADPHHIGRFLIAIRIAYDLSQRDLAKLLGITDAQVSKDEINEYHGISFDRAIKIMEIFKIKPLSLEINKNLNREDLFSINENVR